jgi:acetyl esterase/lipase
MRSVVARIAGLGLLALALVLASIAAFIHVPAPTLLLLPLAVGAPEVGPLLAAATAAISLVSVALIRVSRAARAATTVAAIAAFASITPLVSTPSTLVDFEQAMTAVFGADYLRDVPPDVRARLRPAPFSVGELVRGFREHAVVRLDHLSITNAIGASAPLVVYRRGDSSASPVIVQIYGGAWQRGAPDDDAVVARVLAAQGYVVMAIDYRHAPAARWPAQIDDVRTALTWVRQHAAEYGGDATRMALLGRSAGAHLALLAAYTDRKPGIRAVVGYYSPTDLAEGWRTPPSPDPLDVRTVLETFLGGTPDQRPDAYRDASPIMHVTAASPPTLLLHGSRDHIVEARFGRALHARLRAAKATSILLEVPWAEHGFDLIPNGLSGQLTLYYVERFLARTLSGLRNRSTGSLAAPGGPGARRSR